MLIAGAADEAMLRVVDEVFGGDGPLEVVLLDRCRTPLELSRSCLRSSGRDLPLVLVHGPVQETELEPESFDVVITDGLFSFMGDAGERETIIARLDACLAPGGVLVYSTRVTQGERALEYDTVGRVVQALTVLTWPGPWRERLRLARSQLRKPARTSPFRSTEEFRAAFAAFSEVEVSVDDAAPARALRLHPNFARGTGSRCVRVLALK